MNGLARARFAASAAFAAALLAAMLVLAANTGQADPSGGRGYSQGGHGSSRGGYSRGGGYARGGDRVYRGGGGRSYGGGGRVYGGGGRVYGGGGSYGGGVRYYGGGGYYGGGVRYYGGPRYYYRPYGYRYVHPRTFIGLGIGFGAPYYYDYPPAYGYVVEPSPYGVDPSTTIDVTNEPPAGCYYYDRFCDLQFANLDDYTDHLESHGHTKTVEIVNRDSGDTIRTLVFVSGYWRVQP